MNKNKYKYIGTNDILIYGLGVIKSGETIETSQTINNPLFKLITEKKQNKKK